MIHTQSNQRLTAATSGKATKAQDGIEVTALSWPATRVGEALDILVRQARLGLQMGLAVGNLPTDINPADDVQMNRWLALIATPLGVETEPVQATYADVDQFLQVAGPALLRVPVADLGAEVRFFALLQSGARQAILIVPDGVRCRVPVAYLRDMLCKVLETPHCAVVEQLLQEAETPAHRRLAARRLLLSEHVGPTPIGGCWLVRPSPSRDLWLQLRRTGVLRPAATILAGYGGLQGLTIAAWALIGSSALSGHFALAWFMGWALLLLSAVPLQIAVTCALSRLAVGMGALFKQRLLYGITQLEPEAIRQAGAGQFLGRVLDADAVEQLALTGGFSSLLALIQIGVAGAILALGAGSWLHALLLILWLKFTFGLGWLYLRQSRKWADVYRTLTNDLVERMVGHRTRLAQEERTHWHDEEDQQLEQYLQLSVQVDRLGFLFNALITRGWMVIGLAALAYNLLATPPSSLLSAAALAITLGGVLLALQALTTLSSGLRSLVSAVLAWTQIAPLFQAATRPIIVPSLTAAWFAESRSAAEQQSVLTVRDLSFRYRIQGQPSLQNCTLQIRPGERLLVEGPSGGGKSTLAALLAGLRVPESGLLLLWGLDAQAVGTTTWRRRVVMAPQFHENYIFTGSLAFNLLMGRCWPPKADDLAQAEALCRALGLGELLDRMPAGLQQTVGESGWQLSHGERSRIYIARTLLQGADLIILDESFGALDPANLQHTLTCVLQWAPTVLVIAHP